jgi:23S rRNA pseudouridine2605 synthase
MKKDIAKDMSQNNEGKERIAKVMARAGLCSRRDAERWIADRRVAVNGAVLESPAFTVSPSDKIIVDGKPLPQLEKTRLFVFHKPAGCVTTSRDEQDRTTVFDILPDDLPRLITVGRLDMNTEGLLLLTNNGALSRYLEMPKTGFKRRYRVRVHGYVSQSKLDKLKDGLSYEGVQYGPIEAVLETEKDRSAANSWVGIAIREGKNREVRNIMRALGLNVTRLIRTSYGPFTLGTLAREAVREISADEIAKYLPDFKG